MPEDADTSRAVYQLSSTAFSLAQQAVVGEGEANEREAQARAINDQLTEIWPATEVAAQSDPGLLQAWSEARQDIGYVLSGGELPTTSTRLFQFLQSHPHP